MSPRTLAQNIEIRAQTRMRILTASIKLFGERGFEGASVNAIAKEAKMAKGLIYNHFDTKVDIVKGIVEMMMEMGTQMMAPKRVFESPKHHLKHVIDEFFEFMDQQAEVMSWMLPMAFQIGRYPFVTELVAGKIKTVMGITEELFKELGYPNPEQEAWFFGAIFDGIGMDQILIPDYNSRKMHQYILEKYELNNL